MQQCHPPTAKVIVSSLGKPEDGEAPPVLLYRHGRNQGAAAQAPGASWELLGNSSLQAPFGKKFLSSLCHRLHVEINCKLYTESQFSYYPACSLGEGKHFASFCSKQKGGNFHTLLDIPEENLLIYSTALHVHFCFY